MICLDSNIMLKHIEGDAEIRAKLRIYKHLGLCTTPLNIYEMLITAKSKETRLKILLLVNKIKVLPMVTKSALIAYKVHKQVNSDLKDVPHHQKMIAAIMQSHNCFEIITDNVTDFSRIHGISIL